MTYANLASRTAVLSALAECDRLGRNAFLKKHGYGPAQDYILRFQGKEYDSKAIVGVAHGYQFPDIGALLSSAFSGGRHAAARHLVKLGFDVDGLEADPKHWSLAEVTATVEDYFAMLREEMSGEPYNKAQHNQALRKHLNGRTKASVELKHQNISALLSEKGLAWLRGYLPRGNTQLLLRAVVHDYVDNHPDLFDLVKQQPLTGALQAAIVEPPSLQATEEVTVVRRGLKTDFAERDARNRELGRAGEQWALEFLRARLRQAGRDDLAQMVLWVSQEQGDGLGYDIEAYDPDGIRIYVEVKTTNGPVSAPFLVSANEVAVSNELGERYVIFRIFDFARQPRVYMLRGSISNRCDLKPQVYRAIPSGKAAAPAREDFEPAASGQACLS